MNKKCIFELSNEQHEALVKYSEAYGKKKVDIIRLFCDALVGMDNSKTIMFVCDDKNVSIVSRGEDNDISLISSNKRDDIKKISASIVYEAGKENPLYCGYLVSKEQKMEFGGDIDV